jgi:dihydroorotase
MLLSKFDGVELPASADFHVHLRDGPLMKAVVPTVRRGGVDTVYVNSADYGPFLMILTPKSRSCRIWSHH